MFNVWFGRFLPPSDRAKLYGPFYSNEWRYVRRWHPGRISRCFSRPRQRNRVLGRLQSRHGQDKSVGRRVRRRMRRRSNVLWAGRLQLDFWDPEGGYYLNSTYYGDKNLIAIGVATERRYAGQRRRRPQRSTSSWRRRCSMAGPSQSKASSPITTVSVGITGVTRNDARRLRAGVVPHSESRRHWKIRIPRKVRHCGGYPRSIRLEHGLPPELPAKHHRGKRRTTSSNSSTRAS